MRYDRFSLVLALATILVTAVLYPSLPDRIPVHFGLRGPDMWGPKPVAFLAPVLGIIANFAITSSESAKDGRNALFKVRLVTVLLTLVHFGLLWWAKTRLPVQ